MASSGSIWRLAPVMKLRKPDVLWPKAEDAIREVGLGIQYDHSSINVSMGSIQINLFYQLSARKYKFEDPLLAETLNIHLAGLGLMMMMF